MIVPSTEADLIDKRALLRLRNEGENRKEREEEREEHRPGVEDLYKRETVRDCRD